MFSASRLVTTALLAVFTAGCMHSSIVNRKQLLLVSSAQETKLGEQAFAETLSKEKQCANAAAVNMLRTVGGRVAIKSHQPGWAWDFRLIDKPKSLNAFALPGGKVAVYTGLFTPLGNEAALAAVIGQVVAQAVARQGGERICRGLLVKTGMSAAQITIKNKQHHDQVMTALGLGAQVGLMLPFSREMELEADGLGLIYMAKAGYDPREAVAFWQRFSKMAGGSIELLSTHPAGATRIRNLQKALPQALAVYAQSPKFGKGAALSLPSCGAAPGRP